MQESIIISKNLEKDQSKKKKPWIAVVVVLVIVLAGIGVGAYLYLDQGPQNEDIKEAEGLVEDAQQLVEESHYAEAVEKYESARDTDPGNADVYVGIAEVYLLKNRIDDAEEVLEVGLSNSRQPVDVYKMLGSMALDEGAADLAVEYYKKATKSDKKDPEAAYMLAFAHLNNENYEASSKALNLPVSDSDWYIRSLLLEAIFIRGDTDAVGELIEEAQGIETDDEELEFALDEYAGVLDRLEGLSDEESSPVYEEVIMSYGILTAGYEDIVIDRLTVHLDEASEYWDFHLYLGRAHYMNGDMEKAVEYLSNASAINPSDPSPAWNLARIYAELGSYEEMEDNYVRAIALAGDEERPFIRKEYIEMLSDLERYVALDEQLVLLGTEDPENDPEYALMKARSLVERNMYDEAGEVLATINSTSLSDRLRAEHYWISGLVLFGQGDWNGAQELAEEAISLIDTKAEYHLLLGQIHFENGSEVEATVELDRAVDLDLDGDVSAEATKVLDRL